MIDFEYADLYLKDSVDKQLNIQFDGGTITNTKLHQGQFELIESICSEKQLRFGSCEASSVKFKTSDITSVLNGKWITITETLDGKSDVSFQFGKYKVNSDKPTANRKCRDVIAYDAMYDILNADAADWYNSILPNDDSTVTMKQFRDSFFRYFGVEQEEVVLVNDSMTVSKTIDPSQLSGKIVITAICEINGCFGHMGRNGKFQYIFLKEMIPGLYPSNTLYPRDDLYPADTMNATQVSRNHYISAEYEDFETERINKLQIRQEENDIGASYPEGNVTESDNCYIVQDNFLLYGKSTEELTEIAKNMYSVISKVWYIPARVEAKGNPCLEVGDGIRIVTKDTIIYTYILKRTLKGIQSLRDTYEAEGKKRQAERLNSVREEIIQLKGKSNKLTRTIEETRLEISDVEKGLDSKITQTASNINLSVNQKITETIEYASNAATTAEGNANNATDEKLKSYSTTTQMNSAISAKADEIALSVEKTYETIENSNTRYDDLSGRITINADKITAEVTRAQAQEVELAAAISINADNIKLKVSKGNISSEISAESGKISIKSNRFSLESTNCTISEDGTIKASNVDLSGKITASSGTIGGFIIGENALYSSSASSLGGIGVYVGKDGLSCASSSVSSIIKSDGSAEFRTSGGIKVWSSNTNYSYIKPNGITIKNSTYTNTEYTEKSISAYSSFIMEFYNGLEIDVTSIGSRLFSIKAGSLTYAKFSSSMTYLYGGDSGVSVGKSSSKLGFFGNDGSTKKSVSAISSTSSATASSCATKINEILTALKAYNLIG